MLLVVKNWRKSCKLLKCECSYQKKINLKRWLSKKVMCYKLREEIVHVENNYATPKVKNSRKWVDLDIKLNLQKISFKYWFSQILWIVVLWWKNADLCLLDRLTVQNAMVIIRSQCLPQRIVLYTDVFNIQQRY